MRLDANFIRRGGGREAQTAHKKLINAGMPEGELDDLLCCVAMPDLLRKTTSSRGPFGITPRPLIQDGNVSS